ncbi:DUF2076 domain-containing protein [Bosea sp. (in: a-proteobacteria)]|uniref:DUF2076 domain-containing protein n=1 Tax=Bosea sp. (in: a-proteobacteria) TaxID=1871050 RepID=UPI0027357C7B|nr:DUF2076 domain-containing protein [Bosea sp. (in: a-proteobacteria)]MDP3255982.1 DUF2076 domain-containing protein [Bosea sp. (in: a-proteobacteria)]
MTPQERDVIAGIFDRLKQAANQPRDPEAENFIAERLREQPYAPYAMAQAVYVQETALTNLQAQVEDLQAQLRDFESRQQAEAPAQNGGFLSGIFGGGAAAPRPRSVPSFPQRAPEGAGSAWSGQRPGMMAAAGAQPGPGTPPGPGQQQPGPWGNAGAQAPGRGGFMATALTTAAGVAGGMMLGSVLSNAFGGGAAKAAETKPAETAGEAQGNGAEAQPAAYDDGSSNEANYQQAAHGDTQDAGYDDGSSLFDGGDDDSWA